MIYSRPLHIIHQLLELSILTNLYIALAAFLFCLSGQIVLSGHTISWPLCIHVFFATWTVYQLSRWQYHRNYDHADQVQDNLFHWLETHRSFTKASILLGITGTLCPLLFVHRETLIILGIAGGVSVLYSIPKGLRTVPFSKIFWIALVWSLIGTWLPAAESGLLMGSNSVMGLFLFRFVFIIFITLPFDMCDITADSKTNTRTIPLSLGFDNSKIVVCSLGAVLIIYIWLGLYHLSLLNYWQALGASVIMIVLCVKTFLLRPEYPKWKIMLVYDGSIIVYSCLLIALK